MDETHPRIESILRKHLTSVPAPDGLWDRVESSLSAPVASATGGRSLPAVAAVAAGLLLALLPLAANAPDLAGRAVDAHRAWLRSPAQLDLDSPNAAAIATWLATNCSLNVRIDPVRDGADRIRIFGARKIGPRSAAIDFHVGPAPATLVVTPGKRGGDKRISSTTRGGFHVFTWSHQGQRYDLISSGVDARRACRLCHQSVS